ncbi:unnamed protein product [Linum tenue]|uniref:CDT1 Geminin-binding domain-containing protein n=1 Tax=Linum tenue TaxID=586396 RepID=A0AAV0LJE8_9ROSI|nr:unnamed protein product [Linum tenue]
METRKTNSSHSSFISTPSKPRKPPRHSTPKSKQPTDGFTTQTPDKPSTEPATGPVRRLRNRYVALSLTEIKRAATQSSPTDQGVSRRRTPKSARRLIDSLPHAPSPSVPAAKPGVSSRDSSAKIPEKYQVLIEFFNCLDSSIRLVRLKGSSPSFSNIYPKIESLTGRRFSPRNLAQLKYILPDAIEIKKVMKFDERTSCMKPDLHVTLNPDGIELDELAKSEDKFSLLRKIFLKRIEAFCQSHPEGAEVPEEMLPEPFNYRKGDTNADTPQYINASLDIDHRATASREGCCGPPFSTEAEALEKLQPEVASHLSGSFRRSFSNRRKIEARIVENGSSNASVREACLTSSSSVVEMGSSNSVLSATAAKPTTDMVSLASASPAGASITPCIPPTPIKVMEGDGASYESAQVQSTPAKVAFSPARLMSATPEPGQKKRRNMTPDGDATSSPNKLVRRLPRTRLFISDTSATNAENEVNRIRVVPVDDDIILPERLLESIREKERKANEEKDPAISQAKRRRQMIACLPKLFNVIHFLFQSLRRSVITKEELIHKIIAGHSDIVDKREVEEQLKLLEELVPEWISEKKGLSGDLLCCISKTSNAEAVRARLEEAK